MSRDLTGQKKIDPETVHAAIKALQEKGWDINPYTVADEARIPRSTLYRSTELMDIVSQFRSEAPAQATAQNSARIVELEGRIAELESTIAELRQVNERLEKGEQEAWQAGYNAALYEQKKQSGGEPAPDTADGAGTAEREAVQEEAERQPDIEAGEVLSSPAGTLDIADDESSYEGQEVYVRFEEDLPRQKPLQEREAASREEHDTVNQADWAAPGETPAAESDLSVPDKSAAASQAGEAEQPQWSAPADEAQAAGGGMGWGVLQGWCAPFDEQTLQPVDPPADYYLEERQAGAEQETNRGAPAGHESTEASQPEHVGATQEGEQVEIDYESDNDSVDPKWKSSTLTEDDLRDLLKHRFGKMDEPQPEQKKEDEGARKVAGTKFVGGHKAPQEPPAAGFTVRVVPPDIRKACLVLGLRPEEITLESVHKAWKLEMTREHPDIGGDTEIAVYLNTAKETLYRWLEAQAPKLGKKFGQSTMQFRKPAEPEGKDADKANNK